MTLPDLPEGMYEDESGEQRYWDGRQWLRAVASTPTASSAIPSPGAPDGPLRTGSVSEAPSGRNVKLVANLLLLSGIAIALMALIFGLDYHSNFKECGSFLLPNIGKFPAIFGSWQDFVVTCESPDSGPYWVFLVLGIVLVISSFFVRANRAPAEQ